jgi:hypothetical protein
MLRLLVHRFPQVSDAASSSGWHAVKPHRGESSPEDLYFQAKPKPMDKWAGMKLGEITGAVEFRYHAEPPQPTHATKPM